MRLHTDGTTVVLLCPKARLTWRESGRTATEPVPPNAEFADDDRSGLLCITPSGERDFSARLAAAGAVAADAIDEETVAAVMNGDDSTYLVRGPVSMEGDWPSVIDVGHLEPIRIDWPAGLIWKKGDKSLYDLAEKFGAGVPAAFVPTVECNRFGTAVTSPGSGVVLVVRPESRTPDFCFQLPSQEEAAIYACPSEEGVVVTMVVDGQDAAYLHIAEDGKVLAHRAAQIAVPALNLETGFLLCDGERQLLELVDARFEARASLELPFAPVESASAPDLASFALAGSHQVLRGHVNAKGELVIVDTHAYGEHAGKKRPGEIAAMEARWDPERSHGKPAVGFAAGIAPEPWIANEGKSFEITVHARSTGGAGEGIDIVIGGDVTKHCDFEAVSVDGVRVELSKDDKGNYRAEFPKVELVQGLAYPLSPKPKNDAQKHAAALFLAETHLELKVYGVANKASADLMSVSISALRSDSPPLKWMRPLTIS